MRDLGKRVICSIIFCMYFSVNVFTHGIIYDTTIESLSNNNRYTFDRGNETIYFGVAEKVDVDYRDNVYSMSLSPDSDKLATASYNRDSKINQVKIFETNSWKCIRNLTGFTRKIWCVEWSPDGSRLAASSEDMIIMVFDTTSWECIYRLTGHTGWVYCVSWAPYRNLLASSSEDKSIKIWDMNDGTCLQTLTKHTSYVKKVSWSPNGTRLASCADNDVVFIWDSYQWDLLRILNHTDSVRSISWKSDGSQMASGCGSHRSENNTIKIWDTNTFCCMETKFVKAIPWDVSWCPNGDKILFITDSIHCLDTTLSEDIIISSGPKNEERGFPECVIWLNDSSFISGHNIGLRTLIIWSNDSDRDGYADRVDVFPNDPAAYLDTDNDGYPDVWSEGKSQEHSTSGLHLDRFPNDPAASLDIDNDGFPDEWNPGKSEEDSTSDPILRLDEFPNNPEAAIDSDGDGYPDPMNYRYRDPMDYRYRDNIGPVPDKNTVALWHLNEVSGNIVHDSSGNGNDGIVKYASWESGKYGNGLKFNGKSDIVLIPDSNSLSITSAITIEIWMKVENKSTIYPDSFNIPVIIKNDLRKYPSYQLGINGTMIPGSMELTIGAASTSREIFACGYTDIMDDRWHHIVGTWEGWGTNARLYVDGVKDGNSGTLDSIIKDTDYPLTIGNAYNPEWNHNYEWNSGLEIIIDEVIIYDRALNLEEIVEHSQGRYVPSFQFDAFPEDPAASLDTDHDGYPDKWNEGMNINHSTTGLRLDAFPNDLAASLDTDGDGYPDEWNIYCCSRYPSTTGLVLDAYPKDPDKHEKDINHFSDNKVLYAIIIAGVFIICMLSLYNIYAIKMKRK